ncbi:hypothetical protein [Breoghania sp. L-A4]|uniref:hypothetical protein n=1 Tax=Breoghania sp. L-A4 TaxID=2304600 RepID=UPI000E35D4D0|nr:hypothetical protein [Breoghania sp. L-A4]AXS39866.1 hypothetical protein D1F64_07125 [Breoghania sp. L-A4]
MTMRIAITCNDLVPGCHMPVGAQGLRAYGLYCGLTAHGYAVDIVVPRRVAQQRMNRWSQGFPMTLPPYLRILPDNHMFALLNKQYTHVLCPNWVTLEAFEKSTEVTLIYDFLSATQIEHSFIHAPGRLQQSKRVKDAVLRQADIVIANGARHTAYAQDYCASLSGAAAKGDVLNVRMSLPWIERPADQSRPLAIFSGGYRQLWISSLTPRDLIDLSEEIGATMLIIGAETNPNLDPKLLTAGTELHYETIVATPHVTTYAFCDFERYRMLNARSDVALDISALNDEREMSYSTRTVSSISSGCPVLQMAFTELGGLVEETGAGWVVPDCEKSTVSDILRTIAGDTGARTEARRRTEMFWERYCNPDTQILPLVEALRDREAASASGAAVKAHA